MQNLSIRYTAWVNHRQRRTGHLFQGRYKAILVDADNYLLELVRYIHLNPVRAAMVSKPEDYQWSGHRAYIGFETLPWLTTDWVLSTFSLDASVSRQKYAEFIADGVSPQRRQELHSGTFESRILGSDDFIDSALRKACQREHRPITLEKIVQAVCHSYAFPPSQLSREGKTRPHCEARALAALLVREAPHLSLTDLGRLVGRDSIALSQAARRLAAKAREDESLTERITKVQTALASPDAS